MSEINEYALSKGELRKLNALRKSVGDRLAEDVFRKWQKQQASKKAATVVKPDPVAMKLMDAIRHLEEDKSVKLGRYGYIVKRAQGRGVSGFAVYRATQKA